MNLSKIAVFLLACSLTGCKVEDSTQISETNNQKTAAELKASLIAQRFTGAITINDETGSAVAGVTVHLAGQQLTSNNNGVVNFSNISYGNHKALISDSQYFPFVRTLEITQDQSTFTITVHNKSASQVSLLFGGDTMFGRRYLDPALKTMTANIPDVEGALIRPATASENAQALTQYIADFFQAADFTSVNLESPITSTPVAPHPTKEFSFFSLPQTLDGIKSIGVDYVALGNNHIYDFLEDGLDDTLLEVNNADIAHSGAGKDISSAYQAEYMNAGALKLGLFSATSITGVEHEITYVTDETKGGAADLTETALVAAALEDANNNSDFVIAQMHGGDEYTYAPSSYIAGRFETLSELDTDLLVAHHPHIAQGFAVFNGVPAILGLGNLVFDQDRLETLLGVSVMVKVDSDATPAVRQAFAYPIYVEGYQPKFTHGFLSDNLLRRLAELSDDNITLIPREGYGEIYFQSNQATVSTKTVEISLDSDQTLIDLRNYAPSTKAFLSKLEVIEGAVPENVQLGRDMMIFGDFEDWDSDEEQLEVARWDHTADSVAPCINDVRSGQQALCSTRTQFANQPSLIPFRQTIRAMSLPDGKGGLNVFKDFSLFGYSKADNAGRVDAKIVYTTEEDSLEFATHYIDIIEPGTHDWQTFQHNFSLPSDDFTLGPELLPPRGVKVTLRHFAPASSEGTLMLDDLAMVGWENDITFTNKLWQTNKMHGFDFIKLQNDNSVKLRLTFSTFE